jgi:hypothetical protein
MWPVSYDRENQLANALAAAFWDYLSSESGRYFPLFPRVEASPISHPFPDRSQLHLESLKTAVFDFLPSSDSAPLTSLLTQFCGTLVRLPPRLENAFREAVPAKAYTCLDRKGLCGFLRGEEYSLLLESKLRYSRKGNPDGAARFLNHLLRCMTDEATFEHSFAELHGCRILPLKNGKFASLQAISKLPSHNYYLGTEAESRLFEFASNMLIDHAFMADSPCRLQQIIDSGLFNVQKVQMTNIQPLFCHPNFPIKDHVPLDPIWITDLWSYLGPRLDVAMSEKQKPQEKARTPMEILSSIMRNYGLSGLPLYLAFTNNKLHAISQETFESRGLLRPETEDQALLCSKLPGLTIVSPACVPSKFKATERDLNFRRSFERFVVRLSSAANTDIGALLADNLDSADLMVTYPNIYPRLLIFFATSLTLIPRCFKRKSLGI